MSIVFNRIPGRIYDFAMSLFFAFNNNYTEGHTDFNLTPNKNIEEALDKIKRKVKFDFKGLELFLNRETPIIQAFVSNDDLWRNNSVQEYIEYISNFDHHMSTMKVLKFLNDGKDFNENILCCNNSTINFINSLNISNSIKWEAYQFIQNPSSYMRELGSFLNSYQKLFDNIMQEYGSSIKEFSKYVEKNLKESGTKYLTDLTMNRFDFDNKDLYVTTMFFNSYSLAVNSKEEEFYFLVGIDCEETVKRLYGEGEIENNINIFKSLSDGTRFEILRLISQKEMYGQEIAEKVGLTMASITYHMNFLLGPNIVTAHPEGRKIYYSLNKETLKRSINFLNTIFNL